MSAVQSHPHATPSLADAAQLFGDNALTLRFAPVFARIAEGAVTREQHRELAYEPVEWLREAGYTRLRVPKQYGGEGVSLTDFFALVTRLGEADSNLPQICACTAALSNRCWKAATKRCATDGSRALPKAR